MNITYLQLQVMVDLVQVGRLLLWQQLTQWHEHWFRMTAVDSYATMNL